MCFLPYLTSMVLQPLLHSEFKELLFTMEISILPTSLSLILSHPLPQTRNKIPILPPVMILLALLRPQLPLITVVLVLNAPGAMVPQVVSTDVPTFILLASQLTQLSPREPTPSTTVTSDSSMLLLIPQHQLLNTFSGEFPLHLNARLSSVLTTHVHLVSETLDPRDSTSPLMVSPSSPSKCISHLENHLRLHFLHLSIIFFVAHMLKNKR